MSCHLHLPFGPDNDDFVQGFEAGRIWTLMDENPYKLTGLIFHAVDVVLVKEMLEQKGLSLTIKISDDERWMTFDDV